jgi:hypothetical protein
LTLSAAILKNKNPIYPGSPNTETGYPVIANDFIKYLAPSHKVKAVDLLDSKLNVVCEKEVDCVKNSLLRTSSITYHWISLDTLPPKELTT